MIALDSSALLAIVLAEPEGSDFLDMVSTRDAIIGAPTRLEAQVSATARGGPLALRALLRILSLPTVEVVDFSGVHVEIACEAFERFGRGRHPARLNFGDCMAYAVAKLSDAPLLFKGDDFAMTDIRPAIPQGPK